MEKDERKRDVSGLTLPWKKGQLWFTRCMSHKEYKEHRLGLSISGQEDGSSCLYSHLQLSVWREHHCSFASGFPIFFFLHPDHSVQTVWFRADTKGTVMWKSQFLLFLLLFPSLYSSSSQTHNSYSPSFLALSGPQKTTSTSEYYSEDSVSLKQSWAAKPLKGWSRNAWKRMVREAAHPMKQQHLALRSGQLQCEEWKLAEVWKGHNHCHYCVFYQLGYLFPLLQQLFWIIRN